MRHIESPVAQKRTSQVTSAANTAGQSTITADAEQFWVLDHLVWSYSADPTGGQITVVAGSTTLLDVRITVGGAGFIPCGGMFHTDTYGKAVKNEDLVVTIAAGGVGVIGTVSFIYR